MVPLTTAVLAAVLTVLVGGLFVVVDRILERQVRSSLVDETHEWAASLADSTAKVLWNFDENAVQALAEDAAKNPLVLALEIQDDRDEIVYLHVKPGPALETVRIPVQYGGMAAGTVVMTSAAALVRSRVDAMELPASLAGGLFLLLVALVTPFVLSRTVLRPILQLGHLVEMVDPVVLPQGALATDSRIREVRALETALESLASSVRGNVQTLEARVRERTVALDLARGQLAHAEALATLGQLTAGIAHELNTPLAAILSAHRTLQSVALEDQLTLLASTWSRGLVDQPEAFLRSASERARALDSGSNGRTRTELRQLWKQAGRDTDGDLFDLLATDALLPVGRTVAQWPAGIPEETTLKLVVLSASLLRVIQVAAEKGAAVVQALRGQLKHNENEPSVWFDGATSLERSLLLHKGHFGGAVEVRCRFEPGIRFFGPENRLSQVWLNLINNAFQAAERSGWVFVDAWIDQGWATVRVCDSGPPVPPELVPRLFEPYFTTKATGLGLGLNLSRAIVESLGGELAYECGERGKAFVARWPQPATEPAASGSGVDSGSPG